LLFAGCWLLLLQICVTNGIGQENVRYPQDAGDVIAFVEAFSRADLSVRDALKNLDTVDRAYDGKDGSIRLTPSPSNQKMIKKAVLDIFESKPDRVNIEYSDPILISYGKLKEKYGLPSRLKPPVFRCRPGVDCQPRFVGYSFSFVPNQESMTSGQRLGVAVDLEMQSSKEVPQHTDKDFLEVKAIRFRRVWRGK
jgi:hypothetical protein